MILILFVLSCLTISCNSFRFNRLMYHKLYDNSKLYMNSNHPTSISESDRKDLWKQISSLEREAVTSLTSGDESKINEAYKLLARSVILKDKDPFLQLSRAFNEAVVKNDDEEIIKILQAMKTAGLPPHISSIISKQTQSLAVIESNTPIIEEVDPGSTFSDTVTEKIRVKVNSFFDTEKSDPSNGKYMFWYKVAIHNEGPEPVQIVARMWEIEKCKG